MSDSRGRGFGAHREAVCAPDGPAETAGSAGGGSRDDTRYSTSSLEDARVALAAIASCPPVEHEATIAITIGADGTATRTETPGVPVTTGTCVVTALRSAVFPTRRTTEVARVRLDPHPATTAAVVTRPAADPAAEASARHAIDDLRTAILACSSGAAIAVTGEWTTSGALTLHLSGALAGTPEEGCVRAAASGVVLSPVPTASGSVLQAVR